MVSGNKIDTIMMSPRQKSSYIRRLIFCILNYLSYTNKRYITLPYHCRADSRFAPSQWETVLLCKDVSLAGISPVLALVYFWNIDLRCEQYVSSFNKNIFQNTYCWCTTIIYMSVMNTREPLAWKHVVHWRTGLENAHYKMYHSRVTTKPYSDCKHS